MAHFSLKGLYVTVTLINHCFIGHMGAILLLPEKFPNSPSCLYKPVDDLFQMFNAAGLWTSLCGMVQMTLYVKFVTQTLSLLH